MLYNKRYNMENIFVQMWKRIKSKYNSKNKFNSNQYQYQYQYKYTLNYDPKDKEYILRIKSKYCSFSLYWYKDEPNIVYLAEVFVKKKYRNLGYGNQLLQEAFKQARLRNFTDMYLKCLDLTWVQKWYERNGFVFHELIHIGGCADIWAWMCKTL